MRIRVLDIETTGDAPPQAAICEIGWCDVVSTRMDLANRPSHWEIADYGWMYVDPGMPITPQTSAIHHIIDADICGAPKLDAALRHALDPLHENSPIDALAAHSAKFERLFLTDEMTGGLPWICTYKCALRLWPGELHHSNQALRYSRKPIGLDREIATPAHRAGPDAYVSAFHLRDLLELAEPAALIKWSSEPALQVICHIGKFRGAKWRDVDEGFLYWLLDKDFDEDVKFTARTEIDRRRQEYLASVEVAKVGQNEGAT